MEAVKGFRFSNSTRGISNYLSILNMI